MRMLVVVWWQTNCTNVPPGWLLGCLPMHKSGPRYKLLPAPCLRVAGLLTYHLQCLSLSAGRGPLPGGTSPATRTQSCTQNVTSSWPRLFERVVTLVTSV